MYHRRNFIKQSLATSAVIGVGSSVPQFLLKTSAKTVVDSRESILVVVQMTGGNDGLNTVVPHGDDEYYKNRFTLAVGRDQVRKINESIGFHPSMAGLERLIENDQLTIIQGVGYPNPNRSHFESMDLWQTAHQIGSAVPVGWLGRTIEKLDGGTRAIHYGQEQQPLALASRAIPVPSIKSLDTFRLKVRSDQAIKKSIDAAMARRGDSENQLLGFIHDSTAVALATSEKLESVLHRKKAGASYPGTRLGKKLKAVGQLIDAGLKTRIYYVTLDGFDTHSNQGEAHASLLSELSNAIEAFMKDLVAQGNDQRVCTMVFSEFGRRVRENASRGTDHGTAAPVFVIGSKVTAGPIGEHPSLTDLDEGDLKFQVDYRRVYATILADWLGVDAKPILGGDFATLDLFTKQT